MSSVVFPTIKNHYINCLLLVYLMKQRCYDMWGGGRGEETNYNIVLMLVVGAGAQMISD